MWAAEDDFNLTDGCLFSRIKVLSRHNVKKNEKLPMNQRIKSNEKETRKKKVPNSYNNKHELIHIVGATLL